MAEDKMVKEIGDDEEFEALQDQDGAYIVGWFAGVLAAHKEPLALFAGYRGGTKRAWIPISRDAGSWGGPRSGAGT
jgi:hypothetical protein